MHWALLSYWIIAWLAWGVFIPPAPGFPQTLPAPDVPNPTKPHIELGLRAFQLQFYRDEGDQLADGTPLGGSGASRSGFLLRRAELEASGRVDRIHYAVVAELNGSSPVVREAAVVVSLSPMASLRLGRIRLPFGIETQLPPHRLPLINRMLATALVEQPDVVPHFLPEWGIGMVAFGEPLSGPLNISYAVGLINGDGLETADQNGAKDLVGRVGVRLAGFQFGTSTYRGTFRDGSVDRARTRRGVDMEINPNPLKALLIRAEIIDGRDDLIAQRGWYLLAAYRVTNAWQPIVRIERWDRRLDTGADTLTRTTLGLTYDATPHARVTANYEFRTDDAAAPGLANQAIVQYQLSF